MRGPGSGRAPWPCPRLAVLPGAGPREQPLCEVGRSRRGPSQVCPPLPPRSEPLQEGPGEELHRVHPRGQRLRLLHRPGERPLANSPPGCPASPHPTLALATYVHTGHTLGRCGGTGQDQETRGGGVNPGLGAPGDRLRAPLLHLPLARCSKNGAATPRRSCWPPAAGRRA